MTTPNDNITLPQPEETKPSLYPKVFTAFAVVGLIGLGTCGFSMNHMQGNNLDLIGFLLILVSLIGLVITAVAAAIARILQETKK